MNMKNLHSIYQTINPEIKNHNKPIFFETIDRFIVNNIDLSTIIKYTILHLIIYNKETFWNEIYHQA